MDWPTIGTIATVVTSVAAVLISTYTLYTQRKDKKRTIVVEVNISFLVYDAGVSAPVVMLLAKNFGQQVATLSVPGFLLPNKMHMTITHPRSTVKFPYELLPDKSCQVWLDLKEFAAQLKEEGYYGEITVTGFYRDLVGRMYKSKKWKFDVDEWTR